MLKPILTRYGVVILSCDEEGEIWFHPADVTVDAFYRPPAPSRQNDEGSLLAAPTREATRDELPASWRAFDWREY
ncbi:hypothetical protein [Cellulomonas septica]|uniref:Uncharacterized protein n=1 Tax=Cellulomonas septica TaxID=285080 RepID=A0ABX1JZ81_9CELL|nr:hypothetical protein [Cellulomonas septica]NKY39060.1 hypothetical protein [Cellulomonas septica]